MDYPITLAANQNRVRVAPGASAELGVTVQNLTTLLDQVAIQVKGIDPTWVRVIPSELPVFAQNKASARLIIQPPAGKSQPDAGTYPMTIRGRSQEMLGELNQVEVALEVQFTGDYDLRLVPDDSRASAETGYGLVVHNRSNAPLDLRFQGSDPGNALWYKFEPFQLQVQPGAEAAARLAIRAKPDAPHGPRTFQIAAEGTYRLRDGTAAAAPRRQVSSEVSASVAGAPLVLSLASAHAADALGAAYEVRLANPNPAPVVARLGAHSQEDLLLFELGVTQITVPAQGTATTRLIARPASDPAPCSLFWAPFEVTATPIDGWTSPTTAQATVVQRAADLVPESPAWPYVPPLTLLLSGLLSFFVTFILLASVAYAMGYYR